MHLQRFAYRRMSESVRESGECFSHMTGTPQMGGQWRKNVDARMSNKVQTHNKRQHRAREMMNEMSQQMLESQTDAANCVAVVK